MKLPAGLFGRLDLLTTLQLLLLQAAALEVLPTPWKPMYRGIYVFADDGMYSVSIEPIILSIRTLPHLCSAVCTPFASLAM